MRSTLLSMLVALCTSLRPLPALHAPRVGAGRADVALRLSEDEAAPGRRSVLSVASALCLLGALPRSADASYAMYKASQSTYLERQATGYVPVATDDKATLR